MKLIEVPEVPNERCTVPLCACCYFYVDGVETNHCGFRDQKFQRNCIKNNSIYVDPENMTKYIAAKLTA